MAKTRSSQAAAAADNTTGFTPERFERELKDLAAKAKSNTFSQRFIQQVLVYVRVTLLLAFLGTYSHLSQLNLSPVYGSIPSSIWHSKLLMGGCFLGWAGNVFLRRRLPISSVKTLPIVAVCIPAMQHFLLAFSQRLGPQWGPPWTEALTLLPLSVLTAASAADCWENARLPRLPAFVADATPGIGSWAFFKYIENQVGLHLPQLIGKSLVFTRVGFELLLSLMYIGFAPSKYLVYTAFPFLHTFLLNTHLQSPAATTGLTSDLMSKGWVLLERRESITGYISVLQSSQQNFRALRCDHSLLGGNWVGHGGGTLSEPIYGVFVMLEAVRLAVRDVSVADKDAKALVIGLGVGTTPSAFVTHGINTTVVEMDPVVHDFALKYFDLKENSSPVLQDAVTYTSALAKTAPATYDYIIHDVFTGGAEPIDLFTLEFFQGLDALLKQDGIIAINYAGDLALPTPKIIYRTIKQIFPTCRIYREMPPDMEAIDRNGMDFTNMVIFCRKTRDAPLTFRRPTSEDILQSAARRDFLKLSHEVAEVEMIGEGDDILRRNDTAKVVKWHEKSAMGHWSLMRTTMPAFVWEKW